MPGCVSVGLRNSSNGHSTPLVRPKRAAKCSESAGWRHVFRERLCDGPRDADSVRGMCDPSMSIRTRVRSPHCMSTAPTTYRPLAAGELVFGLVYGAGAETETFQRLLREHLRGYGYRLRTVHLSNYFSHLLGEGEFQREVPDATRRLQDMGDAIRQRTGLNDAAARLAVFLIASKASEGRRDKWPCGMARAFSQAQGGSCDVASALWPAVHPDGVARTRIA